MLKIRRKLKLNETQSKIGKYWDIKKIADKRLRWWNSPNIIRYYNYRICGKYLDGWNSGPIDVLKRTAGENKKFEKAVSVGCGNGTKEMELIKQGFVNKFICYELSERRIEEGKTHAEKYGIADSIEFHLGDFFESDDNLPAYYDLVFWDNSIHHMLDTRKAVINSNRILKEGGYFFCNDYVGANRFQWSDLELAVMNGVRQSLPDEVFIVNGKQVQQFVTRNDVEKMKQIDYSEAADSENIIPSIKEIFQNPFIAYAGGTVFHICLNDILQNIPENSDLLKHLLQIDADAADHGIGQYAFILAQKTL